MEAENPIINMIIVGKYQIISKIGTGAFGEVYMGRDKSSGKEVAIKLEKISTEEPTVPWEIKIFEQITKTDGFPEIYYTGKDNGYYIIIMELLGPNLYHLFVTNGKKFTLKSVLMLADQMLMILEHLHRNNIIHRDMKPSNFVMGLGDKSGQVYLIDYGLATQFIHDNQHIPFDNTKAYLVGNIAFASRNAFYHCEVSRRDDLESLGYVLMYFLRGALPWRSIPTNTLDEKIRRIRQILLKTTIEELCEGLPLEFVSYLKYCRSLKFEEEPDYGYLRKLFRTLAERMNYEYDNVYDWTKTNA